MIRDIYEQSAPFVKQQLVKRSTTIHEFQIRTLSCPAALEKKNFEIRIEFDF